MSYGILVTARLKSKRFKKKILKKIYKDYSIIEFLINNLKELKYNIIVITSHNKGDDQLCQFLKSKKINYYRGDPLDVMKRIYDCAKKYNYKNIISVTADNPFVDCDYLKKTIKFHNKQKNDFTFLKGLPIGLFGYCVNTFALKKILNEKKRRNTEFWGGYLLNNAKYKSKIINIDGFKNINKCRFTIDYKEDLFFCRKVLEIYYKKFPRLKTIKASKLEQLDLKKTSKINKNKKQQEGPKNFI